MISQLASGGGGAATPYANVMKLGTVGLVGYVIALTAVTAVGPHRLTGFGVSRHQSWVPSIDKAHRAYYTAVPATGYRGNENIRCAPIGPGAYLGGDEQVVNFSRPDC